MDPTVDTRLVIHTSERGWLARLAQAYRDRTPVLLVDDAEVGLDPAKGTLLQLGRSAGLGIKEWAGVLVALGVGGIGVWLLAAAFADPEPTSKLGLAIAGGTVLVATGGWQAVRLLTGARPPSFKLGPTGIEISWDS